MADASKRYLILIDDGWRYEKQEVLRHLKGWIDFDVVTHDEQTFEVLRDEFSVIHVEKHSPKRNPLYYPLMFFAAELQTNNIRYRDQMRYHSSPWYKRLSLKLHAIASACLGRRVRYTDVLHALYRHSRRFTQILAQYDCFVFTPVAIQDKRILYEASNAGLEVVAWVYSWDNPMKDNEFFPDADRYLVWNQSNAEDLHRLHGIPTSKTRVVGPVQFDYLLQEPIAAPRSGGQRYVLFACAMTHPHHLEQEVSIIRMIAQMLKRIDPAVQLVVRPYPFPMVCPGDESDPYLGLGEIDNVTVAEYGAVSEGRRLVTREDLREKISQIAGAMCLLNLGSTIGLEASFTTTPVVQLAFNVPNEKPAWLDIMEVLKNDHLIHMLDDRFPNVVRDQEALESALSDLLAGRDERYMDYTEHLKAYSHPLDVVSCKDELLKHLQDANGSSQVEED